MYIFVLLLIATIGHGFKLSPVVGKVLGEMAMGKEPSYNLSPCRIDRFFSRSKI